jgi:hypothetical protein
MSFYRPKFIHEWLEIYRKGGFTQLMREKGWTVLIVFFFFYLIRDSILYLLIPYLAYSNISSCF